MSDDVDLNRRILAGHAAGQTGLLAALYLEAARMSEAHRLIDQACFYFTQAYVFALDAGENDVAVDAKSKLVAYGREK